MHRLRPVGEQLGRPVHRVVRWGEALRQDIVRHQTESGRSFQRAVVIVLLRRVDAAANRLSGGRRFAVSARGTPTVELLFAEVAHVLDGREDVVASGRLLQIHLGLGRSLLLVAGGDSRVGRELSVGRVIVIIRLLQAVKMIRHRVQVVLALRLMHGRDGLVLSVGQQVARLERRVLRAHELLDLERFLNVVRWF